jgi:integrase
MCGRKPPIAENRTVTRRRRPNRELRTREHLTPAEVERLMEAAGAGRWGHRDATMILMAYRHGLRAAELVAATLAAGLLGSTPAAAQRLRSERAEPVSEHQAPAEYAAELHFDCLKALQAHGLYAGLAATEVTPWCGESGFWKPRLPIPVC